ncbi:MAG: hypothetical protein EP343_19690 [Deltaproteobacteria bacterium]|nr:MAG: hypothetical protein EP343_19690 [Deltaproteobacteria bacterium]
MWKCWMMWIGCVAMAASLVACGSAPDGPNGNNTSSNENRTQPPTTGKTQVECWSAADCGRGFACNQGKCETIPTTNTCSLDKDCLSQEVCTRGQCVTKPTTPPTPPQEQCNGIDDNNNGQTDENATCPSGQSCIRGTCIPTARYCRTSDACNPGETCVSGVCKQAPTPPSCQSDSDCSRGETCVRSTCQQTPTPPPGCRTDSDCSRGETCLRGTCQQAPAGCRTDSECSRGEACVRGTCQQAPAPTSCRTDSDCGRGETCLRGNCFAQPQEICNGVDDNNDGQTDENACSGSCTFPLELTFPPNKYSVSLALNPTNGACDPNNNKTILQFQSSHAGVAVTATGGWSVLSTSSGKVYNQSIVMGFDLGKRVTLTLKNSAGKPFGLVFLWSGSVKVFSVNPF